MKQLLITIAAVVLVGCGKSQQELNNELIRALDDGKLWRVKKAVDRGAEVNIYKTGKLSLNGGMLGKAAADGHLEIVQFLLESGADVHPEKAFEGILPIHFAAKGGNEKIVKLLITKGADVSVKTVIGFTPLHIAAINGHKEIVELLISSDADVNAKGESAGTPLHIATGYGHKEIVELLIAKGADVNAKTSDEDYTPLTPLDGAIEENHTEIAALLRKHGAKTGEELKTAGN